MGRNLIELIIEWISSILFIIAGITSTTKYCIKLRIKVGLEITCLIANSLWLIWCIMVGAFGYLWVGILYVILGIIGVINFSIIYTNAKKGKEYKIV